MEELDVVIGISKHTVEWSADEFASTDKGDFLAIEFDIVTGEKPVDGGSSGRVEFGVFT